MPSRASLKGIAESTALIPEGRSRALAQLCPSRQGLLFLCTGLTDDSESPCGPSVLVVGPDEPPFGVTDSDLSIALRRNLCLVVARVELLPRIAPDLLVHPRGDDDVDGLNHVFSLDRREPHADHPAVDMPRLLDLLPVDLGDLICPSLREVRCELIATVSAAGPRPVVCGVPLVFLAEAMYLCGNRLFHNVAATRELGDVPLRASPRAGHRMEVGDSSVEPVHEAPFFDRFDHRLSFIPVELVDLRSDFNSRAAPSRTTKIRKRNPLSLHALEGICTPLVLQPDVLRHVRRLLHLVPRGYGSANRSLGILCRRIAAFSLAGGIRGLAASKVITFALASSRGFTARKVIARREVGPRVWTRPPRRCFRRRRCSLLLPPADIRGLPQDRMSTIAALGSSANQCRAGVTDRACARFRHKPQAGASVHLVMAFTISRRSRRLFRDMREACDRRSLKRLCRFRHLLVLDLSLSGCRKRGARWCRMRPSPARGRCRVRDDAVPEVESLVGSERCARPCSRAQDVRLLQIPSDWHLSRLRSALRSMPDRRGRRCSSGLCLLGLLDRRSSLLRSPSMRCVGGAVVGGAGVRWCCGSHG